MPIRCQRKNFAKKLLATLVVTSLSFASKQAFAAAGDITIGTAQGTVTNSQLLTDSNSTVSISAGGSLEVDGSPNAAIFTDVVVGGLTGLNISVNTNSATTGIKSSGNTSEAIRIGEDNSLASLNLDAGIITSDFVGGATVSLVGAGGETSIQIDELTTVSNTATQGKALVSSTTSNTALAILNLGTISVGDNAASTAITFGDANGGSSLSVANGGIISAGTNGTAIKIEGSGNSVNISNNPNGAADVAITGAISLGSNGGTVANGKRIVGTISSTTGDIFVFNAAGSITGDVSTTSGALTVLLNGGTINGNISLGSSAGSYVTMNGGVINGNISMANSLQSVIIADSTLNGNINGGAELVINGTATVNGNIGNITGLTILTVNDGKSLTVSSNKTVAVATTAIGNTSSLMLSSGSTLAGNINLDTGGMIRLRNGSSVTGAINGKDAGKGTVSIGFLGSSVAESVVSNGNIGATKTIGSVTLHSLSTFDLSVHNDSLNTLSGTFLYSGSELKIGTAAVSGGVKGFSQFSATSNNTGTVTFVGHNTLASNIGSNNGGSLATVNIAIAKNVDTNGYEINATNINIGVGGSLTTNQTISAGGDVTTGLNRTNTTIALGSSALLALNNGAHIIGSVRGSSNGSGLVTAAGTVAVGAIGATGAAVSSFTSAAGSTVTFGGDVVATTFTINGEAIFTQQTTSVTATNFHVNSGSSLSFTIANTAATSLQVAGAAIISSNTTLNLTLSGVINSGTSITLVDATDGSGIASIADTKININSTGANSYGGNLFSLATIGNRLVLTAASSRLIFANENEQRIYDNVQGISSPTGELATLKNYLTSNSYSIDQKSEALKSALPEVDNASNRLAFNNIANSANIISARLNSIYNQNLEASNYGSSFNGFGAGKNSFSGIANWQNQTGDIHALTPASVSFGGDKFSNKSAWLQTFGSALKQGNVSGLDGYNAKSGGVAIGFDCKLCTDFVLGVSAAYTQSNVVAKGASKNLQIDSYQANVYAGYNAKNYFVNSIVGFSINDYSSTRQIAVANTTARANYMGQSYFARLEVGKYIHFANDVSLTPTFAITAARNQIANYSERGAGTLNLHIKNNAANFLEGRAGLEVSKIYDLKNKMKLQPQFSTSYGYDFVGDKQKTTGNFVGQAATFDSNAANIAQGSLKVATGLSFYSAKGASVSVNYGFERRNDYAAHSGWLVARQNF